MLKITIPDYNIEFAEEIISGNVTAAATVAMDELSIDTLTAVTELTMAIDSQYMTADGIGYASADGAELYVKINTSNLPDPREWAYGSEIYIYIDNVLADKFFFSSYQRTGKTRYKIKAVSVIGLLDGDKHYGGIYNGVVASELAREIIGNRAPITIEKVFDSIQVYGYLPIASRRDNLKQLLFAVGGIIRRKPDGTAVMTILDSSSAVEIPASRIYLTGGSISYDTLATEIDVTEHSYSSGDTAVKTLFSGECVGSAFTTPDGYDVTGAALITFSNPAHSVAVEGSAILNNEAHENYCVITAGANITITGIEYVHSTNTIRRYAQKEAYIVGTEYSRGWLSSTDGGAPLIPTYYNIYLIKTVGDHYGETYRFDGERYYRAAVNKDYVISCNDATLISFVNSANVAERMLSYYGGAAIVSENIVTNGEKAGQYANYITPFGDETSGYIVSLDSTLGAGKIKAKAKLTTGFAESAIGNYYNASSVITSAGAYQITASEDTYLRLTIIGGGTGGSGGSAGTTGGSSSNGNGGNGGLGGEKGAGGPGGKIIQAETELNAGQTITANIVIGLGGTGGSGGTEGINNGTGNTGAAGGASTVAIDDTLITSDDGSVFSGGYADLFSGQVYAGYGVVGIDGGNGGNGGSVYIASGTSGTFSAGADGQSNRDYTGGRGGSGHERFAEQADPNYPITVFTCYETAGGGGGGAGGANGSNASSPKPGKGASGGTRAPKTIPGHGGDGGHGGGGGGGAGGSGKGTTTIAYSSVSTSIQYDDTVGGVGGAGGTGGDGAPGCIIIYYNADTITITEVTT